VVLLVVSFVLIIIDFNCVLIIYIFFELNSSKEWLLFTAKLCYPNPILHIHWRTRIGYASDIYLRLIHCRCVMYQVFYSVWLKDTIFDMSGYSYASSSLWYANGSCHMVVPQLIWRKAMEKTLQNLKVINCNMCDSNFSTQSATPTFQPLHHCDNVNF
jgi:hypothetical protein